ncbi:TetR/AcrR family transcriptional regulator [Mycolicibacterium cosmeticum]|uniref:TetR family transcriptional regulator n=1 Tax=Mycolicibacterium cosmeticum TaxID=258533 RepID=W9AUL0_MYCCO|nr:TetR/AcrR family transcriptional regulator [Mycolicibacterium cosmeticum]CDO06286.1 TetR family transcriptional regulator [Mycolicibacterium cosmeticum]
MTAPASPGSDRATQLYTAAVDLFMANGYRDVDVAEIAAAAGASHGTFYNYFRNKRDVLTAIQATTEAQIIAAVSAPDGVPPPSTRDEFVDQVRDRIACAIAYFVENAEFMAFVTLTAAGVDDDALAATLTTHQRAAERFTRLFEHGREHGWVHPDLDLDVAGQATVSAIITSVLPALVDGADNVDVEEATALCAKYLLNGMRGLADPR